MFLHKSDWDRIKRRNHEKTINNDKEEYWRWSRELSQSWIRSWPDTVQGYVHHYEKHKQAQKAKQKQYVQECIEQEKLKEIRKFINSQTAINKARDLIFEDSSYGRQLLSAFHESKTLEERDAQIEFQRKVKDEQNELNIAHDTLDNNNNEKECEKKKDDIKKIAIFNKHMFNSKRIQDKIKRENQVKNELEDIQMIQSLSLKEEKLQANTPMDKQNFDNFIKQQETFRNLRKKVDEEVDFQIDLWRNYEDAQKIKAKDVLKQIQTSKMKSSQENYKLVEKLQNENNLRFEEFIEKGIYRQKNKLKREELGNSEKINNEREKRCLIDEENKKIAHSRRAVEKPRASCRQCILPGCSNKPTKKVIQQLEDFTPNTPRKRRMEELKRRVSEQPWSSSYDAHVRFARRASDTMQQCVYKNSVKKVIAVSQ